MPGWLIQGIRGEGKSLAAVWLMKKYLDQGRPVATNLDLWLENLTHPDSTTPAYRLPDWPRYEDFAMLPPAYDRKYKGEDKNGLLVLDEMALWANSREWNNKGRDKLIKWMLLSRKYHWDLVLLAQDAEMIDKQILKSCCDYLVQSSRSDRTKIPYIGPVLEFFYISPYRSQQHVYNVYYGFTGSDVPADKWSFVGKNLYDAYDTNQLFTDGQEMVGQSIIDNRATFTYLPAGYLTSRIYTDRLQKQIDELTNRGGEMKSKHTKKADLYMKAGLLTAGLVGFVVWRLFTGDFSLPSGSETIAAVSPSPVTHTVTEQRVTDLKPVDLNYSQAFLDKLLTAYRPRLAAIITGHDKNGDIVTSGLIEFYQGDTLVERFNIDQLKAFGCSFIVKPYGADIITSANNYAITAWPRPIEKSTSAKTENENSRQTTKVLQSSEIVSQETLQDHSF